MTEKITQFAIKSDPIVINDDHTLSNLVYPWCFVIQADVKESLRSERNKRFREADKWELSTAMDRFSLTVQQISDYNQALCDIPQTHTTFEDLQNPQWPEKLIEQELV